MPQQMENYKHWLRERGLDYPSVILNAQPVILNAQPVILSAAKDLNANEKTISLNLVFDSLQLIPQEEELLSKILAAMQIDLSTTGRTTISELNLKTEIPFIYFSDAETLLNKNCTQVPSLSAMLQDPAQKRIAWTELKKFNLNTH